MNKNIKEYILLSYTTETERYEIFLIGEEKSTQLKNKEAKIMYKILKNAKSYQLDEDNYMYTNYIPIMLKFKKELNRAKKTKKVNRNKSRNIVIGSALAVTIILALGRLAYQHHQNTNTSNNDDAIIGSISEEIKSENETLDGFFENEINVTEDEPENIQNENYDAIQEQTENFHYYDSEIGDSKALENAYEYDEIFTKYENKYGIDKTLLCAIAAQESSGKQSASNNGKSFGLMAIEKSQWENQTVKAYNFETKEYETIKIDYDKVINDADYNVMIGTAIFQQYFYATVNSGLIPDEELLAYTAQRYNMGPKCMQDILKSGMHWMEGRKFEESGDKEYFENVFSRLENGTIINIRMPDDTYHSFSLTNDALELETTHNRT